MKYFKNVTSICFTIVCQQLILSTAFCQDNLPSITAAFNQYHQNSIKEKIFVHTDKSFYVTGEIAWFKLYIVDASYHKPLQVSKVAYVEITDSANNHLLQAKIPMTNGEGSGSFYLPPSLTSGNYKLRAYTNWMKNFGAAYFFEKNITIVNVQKRMETSAIKSSNKFDIQFFPEGGNLVNNLPSLVAFKALNEYGQGVPFTGILIDNNDTLLRFTPAHAGMGTFSFTPLNNHTYKAIIQTNSGEKVIKALPAAYSSGYVMQLSDSADKIKVTVLSDILSEREVFLFAHTREITKAAIGSSLQNGKAVFVFDKALLADGISHITIFNEQKQPVCERLYFKRPQQQLNIKLNTDQSIYSSRKKVNLTIQAASTDVNNDTANLSMTVYKIDSLQSASAPSINAYLLLTSDLKGFVEDPNYYFLNTDAKSDAALNYIMLTNGWRRFKWDNILANSKTFFKFLPEYNGPVISARVINKLTGTPAGNVDSYIAAPGLTTAFNTSVSDSSGNIKFESKNLYGSSEIILQPKDTMYRIEITDPYSNSFSEIPFTAFALPKLTADELLQHSISMQVQNIYSGKNLKHFDLPDIDTTPFYIKPTAKYNLDDYTRFTTMEEILREYIVMADVRKNERRTHLKLYDLANLELFKNDPLVLLDDVPVFDLNKFMLLDPLRLSKVEVLNRRYFLGNASFEGILSWTSIKGDMADYDFGTNAAIIDYDGLQLQREFYSPAYNETTQASHLPDFRNVLLWYPNIKIASGKSKEINFYTSDIQGKYAIEIQGISTNGLPANKTYTFEVKK